jgi:hypothetical protein
MRLVIFIGFFILNCNVFAQSIQTKVDTVKVHSPKTATLLSTFIPGAGQIYNHLAMPKKRKKAFWKVPLIYAGLGITTYYLIQNQTLQNDLKTEYYNRQNGGTLDAQWAQYDDYSIILLQDQYAGRRDLSILGIGLVYALQIVDANIEASFVNFDISKDLSMHIEPTYFGSNTYGLKFNFKIR